MDILDQLTTKTTKKSGSPYKANKDNSFLNNLLNKTINTSSFMPEPNNRNKSIDNNNFNSSMYPSSNGISQYGNMSSQRNRNQLMGATTQSHEFVFNKENISINQYPGLSNSILQSENEQKSSFKCTDSIINMPQNYSRRNSRNMSRQISQSRLQKHSLGIILSDQSGQQQQKQSKLRNSGSKDNIMNNFSFFETNNENKNMMSIVGMSATQSKIIAKKPQKEMIKIQQQYNDEIHKQLNANKQQIKRLSNENSELKYKLEKSQLENLKKIQSLEKLQKNKIELQNQYLQQIKTIKCKYQKEYDSVEKRLNLSHQQAINAKQQIFNWQIKHLKSSYEQQIQGLKSTNLAYKNVIQTLQQSIASTKLLNSHQNPNKQFEKQNKVHKFVENNPPIDYSTYSQKLNKLYDEFYLQKQKTHQKHNLQWDRLDKQKQQFLAHKNQHQKQTRERLHKRQQQLKKFEADLQRKQKKLLEKQQDLRYLQESILRKNQQYQNSNRKLKDMLRQRQQQNAIEKDRIIQMETNLINKLRIVQLYSQRHALNTIDFDDIHQQDMVKNQQQSDKIKSLQQIQKQLHPTTNNQQQHHQTNKNTHKTIVFPTSKKMISKDINSSHKLTNYLQKLSQGRRRSSRKK